MVKPSAGNRTEFYVLSPLKGRELLVVRSDEDHHEDYIKMLDAKIRAENPEWTGTMLIMRTDQAVEKLPESTAFALFKAMQEYFDPERHAEQERLKQS